jgi:hypothetical protein
MSASRAIAYEIIPLLRRGGTDAVGTGVVCRERQSVVLTTPALCATPPKEGNFRMRALRRRELFRKRLPCEREFRASAPMVSPGLLEKYAKVGIIL